jgi:hypothetical protein
MGRQDTGQRQLQRGWECAALFQQPAVEVRGQVDGEIIANWVAHGQDSAIEVFSERSG